MMKGKAHFVNGKNGSLEAQQESEPIYEYTASRHGWREAWTDGFLPSPGNVQLRGQSHIENQVETLGSFHVTPQDVRNMSPSIIILPQCSVL